MNLIEILLLSLALSADAFTVGTSVGVRHQSARQIFRLSFHFGLFQSLLALAGALAGSFFVAYVEGYDHWIAFGLLTLVGARMIYGALTDSGHKLADVDLTRGFSLVGLSLAVSIDALAAGVGIPAAGASLPLAISLIGVTAAATTFVAMRVAGHVASRLGEWLEIAAGVVLIGLGIWTLINHHAFL